MKGAYYNEFDPYAAQWLRNLIAAGHIAPGEVDERSIKDVHADDLKGFVQCHFFAGIGVWSHALRNAGWDDSRPVWTGSCPCQPFSAAGAGAGTNDERHLWPAFFKLIDQRKPPVVFGEQVEAAIRHGWLDLVQADLEGIGYAFAAAGIPAAGVGAPHIRQRLWFVADTANNDGGLVDANEGSYIEQVRGSDRETPASTIGNRANLFVTGEFSGRKQDVPYRVGFAGSDGALDGTRERRERISSFGDVGALADAFSRLNESSCAQPNQRPVAGSDGTMQTEPRPAGPTNGHWRDVDWLFCRDGKWRPVESTNERVVDGLADSLGYVRTGQDSFGLSPLIKGAKNRVGRLKAYGNAICAPTAQAFIEAYISVRQ